MLKIAKYIANFKIQFGFFNIVASGIPAVSLNLIKASFWIICFLFFLVKTNIYFVGAIWISWKKINNLEQSLESKKTDSFEKPTKENKLYTEKSIRSLTENKKRRTKKGHKQKVEIRNVCCEKTKNLL